MRQAVMLAMSLACGAALCVRRPSLHEPQAGLVLSWPSSTCAPCSVHAQRVCSGRMCCLAS
jgi:hypothetical protein